MIYHTIIVFNTMEKYNYNISYIIILKIIKIKT